MRARKQITPPARPSQNAAYRAAAAPMQRSPCKITQWSPIPTPDGQSRLTIAPQPAGCNPPALLHSAVRAYRAAAWTLARGSFPAAAAPKQGITHQHKLWSGNSQCLQQDRWQQQIQPSRAWATTAARATAAPPTQSATGRSPCHACPGRHVDRGTLHQLQANAAGPMPHSQCCPGAHLVTPAAPLLCNPSPLWTVQRQLRPT